MPDNHGSKQQNQAYIPGQEPENRDKLKKVRVYNGNAEVRNAGGISATHQSGSNNPNLITDHDAIEIFNKILHKNK